MSDDGKRLSLVTVASVPAPKEHTLAWYAAEARAARWSSMPLIRTGVVARAWVAAEHDVLSAFRSGVQPPWENHWLARALIAIDGSWTEPTGMIYLLTTADRRACKVGYSVDPTDRLRQLQTGSPDELLLEQCYPGAPSVERAIHEILPDRLTGEWFALAEPVWSSFFALEMVAKAWVAEHRRAERRRPEDHQ
jgi:hypothetical protein